MKANPPEWSGEVVGLMHVNKISISALAEYIGWRREYVSRLLNGAETRANAKEIIKKSVQELIDNSAKKPK